MTRRQESAAAASDDPESGPNLDALRNELAALREENELLMLHLHEVQEELEDEHRRFGPGAGSNSNPVRGAVRLIHLHDGGMHRHLDCSVSLPSGSDDAFTQLHVRLLDHVGRPGLGLLARRSGERPLAAWRASGEEDEREFMLLVPTDPLGQSLLQHLGRSDWQRVNDVARLIRQEVCSEGWIFGSRWQATAARLCRQLADLPPRWRYDRLSVERVDAAGREIDVLFGGASYADRDFDSVRLRWQLPGGPSGGPTLRWMRPDDPQALPLGSWPTDAGGDLALSMPLPVGEEGNARSKRQGWAAMTAVERELVLAVLDALPATADWAPQDWPTRGVTPAVLRREASALHKEGRQVVASLMLRGVARRLLRRDAPVAGQAGR